VVNNKNRKLCRNAAVIQPYEQVASYFKSVETVSTTIHIITVPGKAAITGTPQFLRQGSEIASFIGLQHIFV
jgi:hypothetical protein